MHIADALMSPQVSGITAAISCTALFVAARRVKNSRDDTIIPIMGVMGAFIFAAQMINFSIPGTGSSGHIVGGILLSTLLGPWAALITLSSVIVIQCLVFADGGLMALGSNILNMAIVPTLIFYPFVYRPLIKYPSSILRIMVVSVIASTLSIVTGALMVVLETELSGVTALPLEKFILFMIPIHTLIGIGEGVATGAAICFLQKNRSELLIGVRERDMSSIGSRNKLFSIIFGLALLAGIFCDFISSTKPDGLEWSILKVTDGNEIVEQSAAIMPDYENYFSGVLGVILVVLFVWIITYLLQRINEC